MVALIQREFADRSAADAEAASAVAAPIDHKIARRAGAVAHAKESPWPR